MHFSSATPAGQVLSLTERHAKSVQSPSATSSQLPKIPNYIPASQWFLFHTFRKRLREAEQCALNVPTRSRKEPFGIPGMVRLALFSFQIARPVLTPAKNHASSQSIRVHLPSKQQKSSPGFSAQLSHQFKVGCHLEPFTTRQDSDADAGGPASSLGYPFCIVEVEAGLSAPRIASSSTHPTCASGSCKCIHWHLSLFPLSAASASYPAESPPDLIHLQPAAKARGEPTAARTDPQVLPPLTASPKLDQLRCHFLAPAAGLCLSGFQLVAVMTTAPGSAQAGTLQGEKFPPTLSESLSFPEHPS